MSLDVHLYASLGTSAYAVLTAYTTSDAFEDAHVHSITIKYDSYGIVVSVVGGGHDQPIKQPKIILWNPTQPLDSIGLAKNMPHCLPYVMCSVKRTKKLVTATALLLWQIAFENKCLSVRFEPIMLLKLPIMLLSNAPKISLLYSNYAQSCAIML